VLQVTERNRPSHGDFRSLTLHGSESELEGFTGKEVHYSDL
jgi:hypothetical protein